MQKKIRYFTGIDVEKFDAVFETLKPYFPEAGKSKVLLENQFLLTLIKLRLNLQIKRWQTSIMFQRQP